MRGPPPGRKTAERRTRRAITSKSHDGTPKGRSSGISPGASQLKAQQDQSDAERISVRTLTAIFDRAGTWNVRDAYNRNFNTGIEVAIRKYLTGDGARKIDTVRQARNLTALDLLVTLLSGELDVEPRKHLSPRGWAKLLVKNNEAMNLLPAQKAFVFAIADALRCPEDAQRFYDDIVKKGSNIRSADAEKTAMMKNALALQELGLVKIGRGQRGQAQMEVANSIGLTENGRDFLRVVHCHAVLRIIELLSTEDRS
jgi:hypothetical protein